ncbi:MAG: amino acid permease, partial [Thermoplasmatota archaeon]
MSSEVPAEGARGTTRGPAFVAQLGLLSAVTLIVGSSIGSGIFLLPSTMARLLPAPGLFMLVWVVCGLLSVFGALTFAELGAMFPRAGGQYVFIREAWGETVAYLYGWTFLVVINTGTIAAVGTAFAIYVAFFFPMSAFAMKLVAIAAILGLSAVNYVGVKYGGLV